MKEKVEEALRDAIRPLNLVVSDVYVVKEEGNTYLKIELDSNTIIDLNRIVEASKIINPIMDRLDLIEEEYILDIYAKEKGEEINE